MGAEQSAAADRCHAPTPAQAVIDTQECSWTAAQGAGPTARESAGAVVGLASGGEALVILGGRDAASEHNDVWSRQLDGSDWLRLEPKGRAPRARSGHTVIEAPGVGLVVFGGLSHEKGYMSDVALHAQSQIRRNQCYGVRLGQYRSQNVWL